MRGLVSDFEQPRTRKGGQKHVFLWTTPVVASNGVFHAAKSDCCQTLAWRSPNKVRTHAARAAASQLNKLPLCGRARRALVRASLARARVIVDCNSDQSPSRLPNH